MISSAVTQNWFRKPVTTWKPWSKRSLLHFLRDALKWLTGTAITRDTQEIKQHVNQLLQAQTKQQDTQVHVISILNITRYAVQVKQTKMKWDTLSPGLFEISPFKTLLLLRNIIVFKFFPLTAMLITSNSSFLYCLYQEKLAIQSFTGLNIAL